MGFWDLFFLSWIKPIVSTKQARPIELTDMPATNQEFTCAVYSRKMLFFFQRMRREHFALPADRRGNINYFVLRLIWVTFKWDIIYIIFLSLVFSVFSYIPSFLLQQTLKIPERYASGEQLRAFAMFLSLLMVSRVLNIISDAFSDIKISLLGLKTYFALSKLVFEKCLRFSFNQNRAYNIGEIINLGTVDANKFSDITFYLLSVITIPFFVALGLVYMWALVGVALLPGLLFLCLSMLLNAWVVKKGIAFQKKYMKARSERIKTTEEVFNNIRYIKTNGLENFFVNKIIEKREVELGWMRKIFMRVIYTVANNNFTPNIMLAIIFGFYLLRHNEITTSLIFTTISVHTTFARSLNSIPRLVGNFIDVIVSSERLARFLLSDEIKVLPNSAPRFSDFDVVAEDCSWKWAAVEPAPDDASSRKKDNDLAEPLLAGEDQSGKETQIENTTQLPLEKLRSAADTEVEFTLEDINFRIRRGELVALVGKSGSGKSSLMLALLGELVPVEKPGTVFGILDKKSYVAQKPWIRNSSVRDNILFGLPFDREKYEDIIRATCLIDDLRVMENQDMTFIGDKGINLSGGQKMRVALARALYCDEDVYLLDDPLSALDINVGDFVFNRVIKGLLRDKTRLVSTHNIPYLKHFDRIIMMDRGRIIKIGTFEEMNQFGPFIELVKILRDTDIFKSRGNEHAAEPLELPLAAAPEAPKPAAEQPEVIKEAKPKLEMEGVEARDLVNMRREMKEQQENSFKLFLEFISMGKFYYTFFILVLMIIYMVAYITKFFFYNQQGHLSPQQFERSYFLKFLIIFELTLFAVQTLRAVFNLQLFLGISTKINSLITYRMLHASLNNFFAKNPIGKVLNRLSGDIETIDRGLPMNINQNYGSVNSLMVGMIILCLTSSPLVIIFIVVYFYYVFRLQRLFAQAYIDVSRLGNVTKTPFYNLYADVVFGVMEIRGARKQAQIDGFLRGAIDLHFRCKYMSTAMKTWFRLNTSLYALLFIVPALFLMVLMQRDFFQYAAILLTSVLDMFDSITSFLSNISSVENGIVSFERCKKFLTIEPEQGITKFAELERALDSGQLQRLPFGRLFKSDGNYVLIPPPGQLPVLYHASSLQSLSARPITRLQDWPTAGAVSIERLFAKYNPKQDWVLKDVTIQVRGGEKVGIIGRTGSGKTSLVNSLNRFFEIMEGSIAVDGVNLADLDLKYARSIFNYVSQDTYFFEGSLRDNIDPLGVATDARLVELLKEAQFWEKVEFAGGLEWKLSANGNNLSFGEKQILCFLRVIADTRSIIIMDEATSNMDIKSESVLESMKAKYFKDKTTFTIAHRLNTVYNSDKILILEAGVVKSFAAIKDLSAEDMQFFDKYRDNLLK